jgi:hypothetical protein
MSIGDILTWTERGFFIIMLLWLRFLPNAPRFWIFVLWGLSILIMSLWPKKKVTPETAAQDDDAELSEVGR